MAFSVRINYKNGGQDEWVNALGWRFRGGNLQVFGHEPGAFFTQRIVHEIPETEVSSIRVTRWGATPVDANP